MNFDRYRFRDRLRRLETIAATSATDDDADRRERQADLKMMVDDAEALTLYHDFLTAISRVECRHRPRGACWPCQRVDPTVQVAWTAYQMRMKILKHSQPDGGQAPSISSITHTPEGGST